MKIIKLSIMLLIICMVLQGCSETNAPETQRYAWPLATCSTEETITHVFATSFASEVDKLSDGKMKINVYSQSTLGVDRELLESCKDGDIPFVVQSPATQVTFMPELCVFDAPCVFDDMSQARANIDSDEFQNIVQEIYRKSGYRLFGIADQGFRIMTSNKDFTGYDSFRGQKIRTMENPFHLQFWKSINANPTPMTFSEVYIGLQQGTINAQENSCALIASAKIYEQQRYLIDTKVLPDYITLIVSEKFFEELPKEQQDILIEAGKNAQKIARTEADEMQQQTKDQLIELGMKLIIPDDDTYAKMKAASEPVYDSIRKQAGDKLFECYTAK